MSLRSGFVEFSVPINLVATPADAVRSFPIVVPRGTYVINANLQFNCNAVPQGVLVSLQTTNNLVPPAPINEVIMRNSADTAGACNARPSGAGTNQSVCLQGVYTFTAETNTIYLVVAGNLGAGETYALTSSIVLNTLTFVQIAP
jgi:hypothetical protein